jgi:nitrite reductase (NADH) large subunit
MKVVIVGTGPAGLTVAETLRTRGSDADVVMLSSEPHPPYSPPAMVDFFTAGREETLFWKGRDVAERLGVEERRGVRVSAVHPPRRHVELDTGEQLPYDALVIASGSRLHAPIRGVELDGIQNFKSLVAATGVVDAVRQGSARSAIIVGCGFIGVEIALLLADLGVRVTVLGRRTWVMPRMLDTETAAVAEAVMRQRGVDVALGVEASAFVGDRVAEGVRMADGRLLTADLYIAATGVKPTVDYLHGSGIETTWGVRVDDSLRTNIDAVYACGDVAEAADRMTGEHYVHAIFPNAVAQGAVVARNLLGEDVVYEGAESMNSLKHLGVPIVAIGAMEGEELLRWTDGNSIRKLWISDGRIAGCRLAGDISGAGLYRSMMLRGDDVRGYGRQLVEPRFGLSDVVLPLMSPASSPPARAIAR